MEPTPGPGHYNLVNYEGEGKRYMSSSMFVSTTSRWNPAVEAEVEVPGPSKLLFESAEFENGTKCLRLGVAFIRYQHEKM